MTTEAARESWEQFEIDVGWALTVTGPARLERARAVLEALGPLIEAAKIDTFRIGADEGRGHPAKFTPDKALKKIAESTLPALALTLGAGRVGSHVALALGARPLCPGVPGRGKRDEVSIRMGKSLLDPERLGALDELVSPLVRTLTGPLGADFASAGWMTEWCRIWERKDGVLAPWFRKFDRIHGLRRLQVYRGAARVPAYAAKAKGAVEALPDGVRIACAEAPLSAPLAVYYGWVCDLVASSTRVKRDELEASLTPLYAVPAPAPLEA